MGRKRLKNNITLRNIWHTYPYRYNQKDKLFLERKQYTDIAKDFFKELSNAVINEGYVYKMPNRLGKVRIRKFRCDKRSIDWKLTKKHFVEENKLLENGNKNLIYHSNKHSSGYKARFWVEFNRDVVYNRPYSFLAVRSNKRALAKAIMDDNIIIKYNE